MFQGHVWFKEREGEKKKVEWKGMEKKGVGENSKIKFYCLV